MQFSVVAVRLCTVVRCAMCNALCSLRECVCECVYGGRRRFTIER